MRVQTIAKGVSTPVETYFLGGRPSSVTLTIRYENGDGDLTTLVSAQAATVDPCDTVLGGAAAAKDTTLTLASKAVTGAVASGGLVKITSAAHGLSTGKRVVVASVGGTVEANGRWTVTVVDANSFTLDGSVFANAYTSGGTWWQECVSGRRYKVGTPSDVEPEEDVTVKSISLAAPTANIWAPLVHDHSTGAAVRGLRVSYTVQGSATANAEETGGFWVNGSAIWTPASGDPQPEIVHCVKFKWPEQLCDYTDVRQVYPKFTGMIDVELDVPTALRLARDEVLVDFGGDRMLASHGWDILREAAALRFLLDRGPSLGRDWKEDVEALQKLYEAAITKARHTVPLDADKDGLLDEPVDDQHLRMGAV